MGLARYERAGDLWALLLPTILLMLVVGWSQVVAAEPASRASAPSAVSSGSAQPASTQPETSRVNSLRAKMDEGQALFIAGKYEEAASVFEEGYESYPYSAFLFNAGVCHQKTGDIDAALDSFRLYVEKDPNAPDAADVQARIAQLEAAMKEAEAASAASAGGAGGAPATVPVEIESDDDMKSLVVVETDPAGAPIRVFRRDEEAAAAFNVELEDNAGWTLVAEETAPANLTLAVGQYQVVVDEYRDFNVSQTEMKVVAGHVHHFKANLSQGEFMGFLRVTSNVLDAVVYVDDDGRKKVAWGITPHGELVPLGKHELLVEAPGYEPATAEVEISTGEQKDVEVKLVRVGYGVVRLDATAAPWVRVIRNEKEVGRWVRGKPALEVSLPAGQHELVIKSKGFKDLRTTVDVSAGRVLPVRATMIEKFPRGAAWAQAAISAALIGTSIYFAVESDRLYGDLQAQRAAGTLSPADSRLDQGFWYSVGANAGFGVGAIFGGLSIYNFVRDPRPDPELRRGKRIEFRDAGIENEKAGPLPSGGGEKPDLGESRARTVSGSSSSQFFVPPQPPPPPRPQTNSIIYVADGLSSTEVQ